MSLLLGFQKTVLFMERFNRSYEAPTLEEGFNEIHELTKAEVGINE